MDHPVESFDQEARRRIALKALASRVRPGRDVEESVATELFELEDRISRWNKALLLLEASFSATPENLLTPADRRTFKREVSRRRRVIREGETRREKLLDLYAAELIF